LFATPTFNKCYLHNGVSSRTWVCEVLPYYTRTSIDLKISLKVLVLDKEKTIILPVVSYGCETWLLTLREKRRLRVLENRVLRRIFGPKRDDVQGKLRKLHYEELNNLYSTSNIVIVLKSRRMRWAENVAGMGERRGVYRVLVGNPEGKRPLGRPRSRWEYNVKIDHQEVGCGGWSGSISLRIRTGGGHL